MQECDFQECSGFLCVAFFFKVICFEVGVHHSRRLIGSGFEKEFGFEGEGIRVCGCSRSIQKALQEILILDVNIIVLDLYIEHYDPIENIRLLKKMAPLVPIVILTHEEDLDWKVRTFNEGVSAYIIKSPNIEDMRWTFLKVAEGNKIISDEILATLNFHSHNEVRPVLESKEKKILLNLINGFSIIEIANSMYRTPSAVAKVLHSTRVKFKVKTNCQLIAYLIRMKIL